jgi:hypothetical protein
MTAAVQVLIDAAGYEFNADKQQDLLLAAGFGKVGQGEVCLFVFFRFGFFFFFFLLFFLLLFRIVI